MDQIQTAIAVILPYAITGAIITAATQYIKQFVDEKGHKFLVCLVLSFVGGATIYVLGFVPPDWVTAFVGVWAAANSIYLGIVKWFQPTPAPSA